MAKTSSRFEVQPFLDSISSLPLAEQRQILMNKRVELESDLTAIREQVQSTTEADKVARPDWWKRLRGARHVKGLQIQQITTATGRVTAALRSEAQAASDRASQSLSRCFMLAARERLRPEDYETLLEHARGLQAEGARLFIGKLYYQDEEGTLHFMCDFTVAAPDRTTAESRVLDQAWDNRLDAASCAPHFEYEASDGEEEEGSQALSESVPPAEAAGEAVASEVCAAGL